MTTKNDITGDSLVSRTTTDSYRDNWDRIFGKKQRRARLDSLVLLVQQMVIDSGNNDTWDAFEWANKWIAIPQIQLNDRAPQEFMDSDQEFKLVLDILSRYQASSFC